MHVCVYIIIYIYISVCVCVLYIHNKNSANLAANQPNCRLGTTPRTPPERRWFEGCHPDRESLSFSIAI